MINWETLVHDCYVVDNTAYIRELENCATFKAFFKSFKAGLKDNSVGRTYFTGVLPITLDDLSSGFNVGTVISLDKDKLGMVGFTEEQVRKYSATGICAVSLSTTAAFRKSRWTRTSARTSRGFVCSRAVRARRANAFVDTSSAAREILWRVTRC